jgi:hypothetical protein
MTVVAYVVVRTGSNGEPEYLKKDKVYSWTNNFLDSDWLTEIEAYRCCKRLNKLWRQQKTGFTCVIHQIFTKDDHDELPF